MYDFNICFPSLDEHIDETSKIYHCKRHGHQKMVGIRINGEKIICPECLNDFINHYDQSLFGIVDNHNGKSIVAISIDDEMRQCEGPTVYM